MNVLRRTLMAFCAITIMLGVLVVPLAEPAMAAGSSSYKAINATCPNGAYAVLTTNSRFAIVKYKFEQSNHSTDFRRTFIRRGHYKTVTQRGYGQYRGIGVEGSVSIVRAGCR